VKKFAKQAFREEVLPSAIGFMTIQTFPDKNPASASAEAAAHEMHRFAGLNVGLAVILTNTSGWMRIIPHPFAATCENGSLPGCPSVNTVRLTPTILRAPTLIVNALGSCSAEAVLRTLKDFLPFFATVTTFPDRKSAAASIEAVSRTDIESTH